MQGRADGAGAPAGAVAHQVFTAVRRAGGEEAELHPLRDINNKEIEEVKQLKHPPREVARVMEVVHLLLSLTLPSSIDWGDVLRTVVRVDFLKRARNIDMDAILEQPRLIDYICRRYFAGSEPLTPDRVRWASKAVVAFFGWTVAIIAGCLPAFPAKVGGEESRRRIILLDQELREERRQKRDAEEEQRKATEQHRAEKQRREEERQREKQREEQARQKLAAIEAAAADKKRAEVFKQRRAAAKQRKLEAKIRHKKRLALGLHSDESGSEVERCRGVWNSNNPDIRFLRIAGAEITFLSDEFADHCTAVSCQPMHYGQHFYEFIVHHFSDQLRCGVTTDAVQAGALVAGHNLRGWCYNTGRRSLKAKTMPAGLQVNGKVVQEFSSVDDGDIIGVLVDADRWSIAFLKNRVLEGSCAMSSHAREPLYLLLHMDAAGDHVELRHVPLQEAPAEALAALESFSPPSWQIVVSDCSDCSSVSEGEGIPGSHPTVSSVSSSTGDLRVASKSLLGAAGAILAHKPSVTSNPPAPAEPFPPAPTTMPRDPNNDQSVVVGLKARLRELKDCLDEGLLTMDEFQEEKGIILRAMRPSLNASGTGSLRREEQRPSSSHMQPSAVASVHSVDEYPKIATRLAMSQMPNALQTKQGRRDEAGSNAVCVGDAPDGVFFVKVAPTGDETQDPGLACINLADLLEAPRQLPLDCLLGLGNKEECELYSSAPEPYVGKSVQTELYGRLPWLLGLLVFLSVSSAILEFFDVLLQKHLIIAFYLTALVGCGGNAGSQAASLVLQALATGELAQSPDIVCQHLLISGVSSGAPGGIGNCRHSFARLAGRKMHITFPFNFPALCLKHFADWERDVFGGSAVDALAIALAMAVTDVEGSEAVPSQADPAKVSGPLLSTVIDIAGVLVACLSAQLLEAVGAWDTMEQSAGQQALPAADEPPSPPSPAATPASRSAVSKLQSMRSARSARSGHSGHSRGSGDSAIRGVVASDASDEIDSQARVQIVISQIDDFDDIAREPSLHAPAARQASIPVRPASVRTDTDPSAPPDFESEIDKAISIGSPTKASNSKVKKCSGLLWAPCWQDRRWRKCCLVTSVLAWVVVIAVGISLALLWPRDPTWRLTSLQMDVDALMSLVTAASGGPSVIDTAIVPDQVFRAEVEVNNPNLKLGLRASRAQFTWSLKAVEWVQGSPGR
ncbi:unnamed protein product [Symbiodinium necroappetens]|uniref:B30.2/SPRY domain-containing protein n=1 Tax=Symbiodinium necroappetens TaxID=1628268 RepID=A0A813C183_9DINO|nr:unnamed protein product [Symbiodinium necroappetens]